MVSTRPSSRISTPSPARIQSIGSESRPGQGYRDVLSFSILRQKRVAALFIIRLNLGHDRESVCTLVSG